MHYIGHVIKTYRKKHGWSQAELANKINKSVSAVSSYENDVQSPPLDVALSISEAFGIALDDLVSVEKPITISTQRLTEEQRQLTEALFAEFVTPTNNNSLLSAEQSKILNKLIKIFTSPK